MSSCLSGGGRAYGFDLEIVKPPSPSTYSSHSSSPSSTISESSNSPLAISTRKPRTPRKRPNQTYTEAAALLSTIYPSIFSTKHLQKPCKHMKSYDSFSESSELLPPFPAFDNPGFPLQPIPEKPTFRIAPRPANSGEKSCHGPSEIDFRPNSPARCDGYEEDFDAGLILDEVDEGIDSIMGNLSMCNESYSDSNDCSGQTNDWCGNPMGLGFGGRFEVGVGFGGNVRALRHVEDEDWWRNPTVEVINILPKFKSCEKKKKKKKVEEDELKDLKSGLCLKLNYEDVLSAWSDRSPFSDQISMATGSTADAIISTM
ncbi:protein CHLOROPLAST IMPORT APPARATUS 2-like isoform X2 [Magnolia sinica]|uniref:protein CHLOROPLAST IMPORT APPARATUS 2-like isoform X2 n=1 Tax=Magnolia sinica TaxID=86752 RepID=UPI00265A397A|nr:protein CHLOROPLAST IMPORT APPARATUS 2-like isoform X2 [Magnolia sinica]